MNKRKYHADEITVLNYNIWQCPQEMVSLYDWGKIWVHIFFKKRNTL